MKFILTTFIPFICMLLVSCKPSVSEVYKQNTHTNRDTFLSELKEGDILFHTSTSSQSSAIQLATHSVYSHCGLLFHRNANDKNWYVLEAVQPVKWTPLDNWIVRGKAKHLVIKRAVITIKQQDAIKNEALKFLGKNYDYTFEWSDNKIYCSELVWKAYFNATGIKLGNLLPLSSFDLKNKQVSKILKERYGDKIPYTENVISPNAIFTSDKLTTVYSQ